MRGPEGAAQHEGAAEAALSDAKAAARTLAFARRKVAFGKGQGDAGLLLADVLADVLADAVMADRPGAVLAGYMPMRTEIDPLAAMAAHPGPVCVPVVTGRGKPLEFRAWSPGASMVAGDFGVLVPDPDGPVSAPVLVPRLLIVPLLAFDDRGHRLGYGGGFYDRTLQALRAAGPVTAIGFAFAAQKIGTVPAGPTDQRLDAVVTEHGLYRFT